MRIDIRTILEHLKSSLYRNSLFLMTSTVARVGLGFLFWIVIARFYSEAEVGWGSAIISAIELLAFLSSLGLNTAFIRFLPRTEKPQDMINSCLTLTGVVALALSAIFIIGLDIWSPALHFIREHVVFSLAFIFFVLLMTLTLMIDSVFISKRKAEFVLFRRSIVLLLRLPLPVLMALFFHAFGIAASWGIALGIAFVIAIFLFMPRVQNQYRPMLGLNLGIISNMRRYSTGNYLASLSIIAPTHILPIMIVNLLGAEQNAYFYMGWMIAGLLSSIPMAVSQSLFAEGVHLENELWGNVGKSF
ncbi:lipopolysaccharide biosynthesis protein, partial [Chloroflexota bacterium]